MARKKKEDAAGSPPGPKRGGSDTIRELGLKSTLVPVSPEEHQSIRTAAGIKGVPVNQFMREAAVDAARKVIGEFKANGGGKQPSEEGKPARRPRKKHEEGEA